MNINNLKKYLNDEMVKIYNFAISNSVKKKKNFFNLSSCSSLKYRKLLKKIKLLTLL